MRKISYMDAMRPLAEALEGPGAFLNVPGNTMTIGWATIGNIWKKPILVVLVRASRHTHACIERAGQFTVSVPRAGTMKAQLAFAGSMSGRDVDKFTGHGIDAAPAQTVDAPIVTGCHMHIECVIRYHRDMRADLLDPEYLRRWYPDNDLHTMYYGEIVDCYEE